jgi:ribosomal protein S18 acetylase RimI-like enzyme
MNDLAIRPLQADPDTIEALAALLVEAVAHGGSVTFMHPLDPAQARAFWQQSLAMAERGERIVLGAYMDDTLASTVTLQLACPENQPHRAEIAKMITRVDYRGRGLASALLRQAEERARGYKKTLLVLDTAADEGAAGLYEACGYTLAGIIPDYAYKPHGGLTATKLYWKRLEPPTV